MQHNTKKSLFLGFSENTMGFAWYFRKKSPKNQKKIKKKLKKNPKNKKCRDFSEFYSKKNDSPLSFFREKKTNLREFGFRNFDPEKSVP